MKKTRLKEDFEQNLDSFFEEDFSNHQISVFQNESALEKSSNYRNEEFLDKFLTAIKLIFLYVPGAMSIHFVGMVIYFSILFNPGLTELASGLIVGAIVGTFLTMFGIGKMNDLNYLKVPASIFTISVLISIIFALITAFTGVEMTGIFLLMSFPITIICGYIVKRFLDKQE